VKRDKVEEDLVFVGLVGIKDPPRDGVIESIEICERAGIAVHMLTGTPPFLLSCTAQGQVDDLPYFLVQAITPQLRQPSPDKLASLALHRWRPML